MGARMEKPLLSFGLSIILENDHFTGMTTLYFEE
jgi:hypothetical protein